MPIDSHATTETINLYNNLKNITQNGIIFGHQNAEIESYGEHMMEVPDVFSVSGKNPGVIGFDFREVADYTESCFAPYMEKVKEVYNRGGIITFSWHMKNIVTGGSASDDDLNLAKILPGGRYHSRLTNQLDIFARFAREAIGNDGKNIPILFRPWHEPNGRWFWWSARRRSDEFKKLWRFTVHYLKDIKNVHNLLFVYSPNKFRGRSARRIRRQYFHAYPGDNYVDVLALDAYEDSISDFEHILEHLVTFAKEKNKMAAISEMGTESIPFRQYWTRNFMWPLQSNPKLQGLSYAMFWRNAQGEEGHFFAPTPGHHANRDFMQIVRHPYVIFNEDFAVNIYQGAH